MYLQVFFILLFVSVGIVFALCEIQLYHLGKRNDEIKKEIEKSENDLKILIEKRIKEINEINNNGTN